VTFGTRAQELRFGYLRHVRRLSCLFLFPCVVWSQETPALPLRVNRTAALQFLRPLPLGPVLPAGKGETTWNWTVANEMRGDPGLLEDAETWRVAYLRRWGTKDGEWSLEIPFLSRGGGILDPMIQGYHRMVAFGVPLREQTPFGNSEITLPGSPRFGSASGVGDVTVGFGKPLGHATAARAWVKLPTGDPTQALGSGNADVGLSVDHTFKLGRSLDLQLTGGLVAQGRPRLLANTKGLVETGTVALAWRRNSRDTWGIQWTAEGAPQVLGIPDVDMEHRVVSFTYTRRTGADSWVSAYFSEDRDFNWVHFPQGAEVGPDFTLGIIWRCRK